MNKRQVYLILGASGSGRREVLADLIADGLGSDSKTLCAIAASEAGDPHDSQLGKTIPWSWNAAHTIDLDLPEDCDVVFFITDGHCNPVDQVEAFREWVQKQKGEVARVLCVVNCQFAEKHPELQAWYDACIHFSDVVLMNRREGVQNKWVSDFIARYDDQYFPCLFELVKAGRVKNPAQILDQQARRISQVFEDSYALTIEGLIIEDEDEDGKKTKKEEDDEDDALPPPDPYFIRKPGGRRAKEIPDIASFLGK